MTIKLRTYYWNKEKTKILGQSKTIIEEDELCQIINDRFVSGENGISINLNRENLIFETSIDEIISN